MFDGLSQVQSERGPSGIEDEEVGTGLEPRHLAQQGSCAASASGHVARPKDTGPPCRQKSDDSLLLARRILGWGGG